MMMNGKIPDDRAEIITGGANEKQAGWAKFCEYMRDHMLEFINEGMDQDRKALINAIREKDYNQVAVLVVPLLPGSPVLQAASLYAST